MNLPLTGAPAVEMRNAAGAYKIVLTFDRNVLSDTSTTITSGVGTVSSTAFSGNTATVQLSGVADRQTIILELDNVIGIVGVNAKVLVSMSICVGDVNQSGAVTVEDIDAVKAHSGPAPNSTTFIYDLNHDGFLDSADIGQIRSVASQGASLFPDFAYTGHYYHARSGLYLAPYRAYNPTIGRWLSRDPIGEEGGLNLYAYVSNNPPNAFDELGLQVSSGPILPSSPPMPFQGGGVTTGGSLFKAGATALLGAVENYYYRQGYSMCERTPHSPLGSCARKCCIVEVYFRPFGGGTAGYSIPFRGSGGVVDKPCDDAKRDAVIRPLFYNGQFVKPDYIPW